MIKIRALKEQIHLEFEGKGYWLVLKLKGPTDFKISWTN
jgi:hypothetical protein